jgi:hypothetical protein
MLSVLDLDPVRRSASTVRPVFVLRYQTLQAHQAGVVEQVGAYLALFEVSQEDTVDAPSQKSGEVVLAQMQWKLAEVLTVVHEDVEGVEPDLIVMLSGVQTVEIRDAVNTEQHSLAVEDERTTPIT